ncbi:hypothetical protein [Marvinbryantia formatexigens]|nr:hypothetical protein [Marvinbryantia formatexigens]UWO25281.1 hypothetical protein NQ534_01955 [Marvinbryantia formatexigens DSM 14469]SDH03050.1 hypothetical protein SAMN05660368_03706 [Marvinbryantia formatexigens]
MLDSETAKRLEHKVLEKMNFNQSNISRSDLLLKTISEIAIKTTIITLQEYERLNNEDAD